MWQTSISHICLLTEPQTPWSKKMTEIKEEIENSKIIVGGFNSPLSIMDRKTRQKINKETENL